MRLISKNRKAFHNYFVEDDFEAGIVLMGSEVKSCYESNVDLSDGYITINDTTVILKNVFINRYFNAGINNHVEKRDRFLLLNRHEIKKMVKKISEKGYTLIPLSIYVHDKTKKIKVSIGVCKGKKQYDKRDDLKKKQIDRDIKREMKR